VYFNYKDTNQNIEFIKTTQRQGNCAKLMLAWSSEESSCLGGRRRDCLLH